MCGNYGSTGWGGGGGSRDEGQAPPQVAGRGNPGGGPGHVQLGKVGWPH